MSSGAAPTVSAAAEAVHAYLKKHKRIVPLVTLHRLIYVAYIASLQSEEQRRIVVTLAYIDPKEPDPDKPPRIRPQRWTVQPFTQRFELTVRNLVKVAPSASPSSTLVAVYARKNDLFVWGLIDQQTYYRSAFNLESEGYFPRPGLFQLEIIGVGTLQVFDDSDHIVTLREDRLIRRYPDVLWSGPVSRILSRYVHKAARGALKVLKDRKRIGVRSPDVFSECVQRARELWTNNLCRILLRIQWRRHGGGVLITPNRNLRFLDPKYALTYDRLESILTYRVAFEIANRRIQKRLRETFVRIDPPTLPVHDYLERIVTADNLEDYIDAETGAVGFVASLSSVDGLILMQEGLNVQGYGVEITRRVDPPAVFVAGTAKADDSQLRTGKVTDYGMRHRSMMRYCFARPGSVGFVISQDGYVRCVTRVERRLVMWENIRLQGPR